MLVVTPPDKPEPAAVVMPVMVPLPAVPHVHVLAVVLMFVANEPEAQPVVGKVILLVGSVGICATVRPVRPEAEPVKLAAVKAPVTFIVPVT